MLPLIFLVILVVKIETYMLVSPEYTDDTCKGKCNSTELLNKYQCHCHDICLIMRNCCGDYQEICKRQSADFLRVSDDILEKFSEELYEIERSVYHASFKYKLGKSNYKGDCNVVSDDRLIQEVLSNSLQTQTISALIEIYNGGIFHADVDVAETYTRENSFINNFIDAVLLTEVWKKAAAFLSNRLKIEVNKEDFYSMWFELYSRAQNQITKGSSAFEHTFLGEIKGNKLMGFHNWIYFQTEENAKRISYLGYKGHWEFLKSTNTLQPNWGYFILLIEHTFKMNKKCKPTSSMFIGTSPEFEIALYTVCRYARFKENCPILMNGIPLFIQTHKAPGRSEIFGSAYPNFRP